MGNERRIDLSLYLVTDRALSRGRDLLEIVRAAVEGGVTVVQLREKEASTREFYRQGLKIRDFLAEREIPLIVNDRLDLALALEAEGLHLGQDDMPLPVARRLLGPDRIIGVSVFDAAEARRAEEEGADYLGLSPVFLTTTKADLTRAVGIEGIPAVRRSVTIPLVGIGGLGPENAYRAVRAGLDGVAVVSAICASPDPAAAARAIRAEVDRAKGEPGHGREGRR